jgi:hypothetical protein
LKYSGDQLHGRAARQIGLGNLLIIEQDLGNVWQLIQTTASEDAA